MTMVGLLAVGLVGCSSKGSPGTPDSNVTDSGVNLGGGDVGTNYTTTTIAGLLSSPPSTGTLVNVQNTTLEVEQTYASGAKWKGYAQDTGVANGLDLFCDSLAHTNPCFSAGPAAGMTAQIVGVWDPYMGVNELIPLKVFPGSKGSVTYAASSVPSAMVAEGANSTAMAMYGAPIHLSGGPWYVSSLTPTALVNTSYQPMCAKGPMYFGFEVTDMADGSKIYVTTEYYKSINFTNDASCSSTGCTLLTVCTTPASCPPHSVFTTLGGIVDNVTNQTSPAPGIKPINPADYTLN